jgi:hypothetical protein
VVLEQEEGEVLRTSFGAATETMVRSSQKSSKAVVEITVANVLSSVSSSYIFWV